MAPFCLLRVVCYGGILKIRTLRVLEVAKNGELCNRAAIRNTGGSILPYLTTTILKEDYIVRGYPSLGSAQSTVRVLGYLKVATRFSSGAMVARFSNRVGRYVSSKLVGRVHSSIIFLNTVLSETGETRVDCPKNYDVNTEPVSLRLGTFQRVNIAIRRRGSEVFYSISGLGDAQVRLSFPDINTARGVVLLKTISSTRVRLLGKTGRPRVLSLRGFVGSVNNSVDHDNSGVVVGKRGTLCSARCGVVPSEVTILACLYTIYTYNNENEVGYMEPRRVTLPLGVLRGTNDRVRTTSGRVRVGSPGEPGNFKFVGARPCPNFPASTRTVFVTTTTEKTKGAYFTRGVFRGHFRRTERLVGLNTSVSIYSGATFIAKGEELCNNELATESLHNNTSLIVNTLSTENASVVRGVNFVSENCRGVREDLDSFNTRVIERRRGKQRVCRREGGQGTGGARAGGTWAFFCAYILSFIRLGCGFDSFWDSFFRGGGSYLQKQGNFGQGKGCQGVTS